MPVKAGSKIRMFTVYDTEIKEVLYTLINGWCWFQADPAGSEHSFNRRWHVSVTSDSYRLMKEMGLVEIV